MKKSICLYLLLISVLALGLIVYGCGGAAIGKAAVGAASTELTINGLAEGLSCRVEIPRAVSISKDKGAGEWNDTSYGHCNPWYKDMLQTPSSFVVGVAELKMLTQDDYDDPNAVTIDLGGTYSIANPKEITLTAGPISMAPGSAPSPGTYTHMGFNLVFAQQTISGVVSSTNPNDVQNVTVRLYASTSGKMQSGDVLIYSDGVWNWVKVEDGSYVPISQDRPGGTASGWDFPNDGVQETGAPTRETGVEVLQDMFWSLRSTNDLPPQMAAMIALRAANNYIFKENMQFPTAQTIVAGKSYTGTVTFDVATTNDTYMSTIPAANGTGTFFWDDVTEDGVFKPAISYANGGDQDDGTHGEPTWCILPPSMNMTLTQN